MKLFRLTSISMVRLVTTFILLTALHFGSPSQAQSQITDSPYFDPEFEARYPGGLLLNPQLALPTDAPAPKWIGNPAWRDGALEPEHSSGDSVSLGSAEAAFSDESLLHGDTFFSYDVTASGIGNDLGAAHFSLLKGGCHPIQELASSQTPGILDPCTPCGLSPAEIALHAAKVLTEFTANLGATDVADTDPVGISHGPQFPILFGRRMPHHTPLFLASFGLLVVLRRRRFQRLG